MQGRKVVVYELNEVPFRIFDYFSASLPGSPLAKLRQHGRAYETLAEDTGHLSPWITWPSLHRGVINDDHEISDFGMDLTRVDREFPPIWKLLTKAGVKCGVFGSLHTYPLPEQVEEYSFFVPDTFAAGPECFPKKLEAFQDFNLAMAGMNGRTVNRGLALKEAAQFLKAAPGLGLRGATVAKLGRQLLDEQMNGNRVVRRRTSQVQIAFDFFLTELKAKKPHISFFFTNHVASSLHRYWPALFPTDYKKLKVGPDWIKSWEGEIPFVMEEANAQIGKLMRFVESNSDYVLMLATSMGQAAVEGRDKVETEIVLSSLQKLMSSLSMRPDEWQKRPAMAPQYIVYVEEHARNRFRQNLGALSINGRGIDLSDLGEGVFRLQYGLENAKTVEVVYMDGQVDPGSFGIENVNLQDAAGANAYHIPSGMLIVYDPRSTQKLAAGGPEKISTLDVAPSLLRNFNVNVPSYMKAGAAL